MVALRTGRRSLAVVLILVSAVLIAADTILLRGFNIPQIPLVREQLMTATIAVVAAAIVVCLFIAVLVLKSGGRRFEP